MKIEDVKHEEMAALESLAKTNVDIGKARGALAILKADEVKYLTEREEKGCPCGCEGCERSPGVGL